MRSRRCAAWATGWRSGVADASPGGEGPPTTRWVLRDRLGGVRVRAALAATGVVALILAVAAVAFVVLQRRQLEATLTDVAAPQAAAGAADLARHRAAGAPVTPAGRGGRAPGQ